MSETATTERSYTTLDKAEWGDGPWQSEPDKVQWKDEATGLACLAVRQSHSGHWCGYVGVPPGHPAHGLSYDDAYNLFGDYESDTYLSVHGGLTYADSCAEGSEETSVCHVPEPGEPEDVWWLGFDCAHSGDFLPAYHARYKDRGYPFSSEAYDHAAALAADTWRVNTYRTLNYVRSEASRLAAQLAAVDASTATPGEPPTNRASLRATPKSSDVLTGEDG